MKLALKASVPLFLFLVAMLALATLIPGSTFNFKPRIMPGDPIPADITCQALSYYYGYDRGGVDYQFCSGRQNDGRDIYLTRQNQEVVHVTYMMEGSGVTMGMMVKAWGPPLYVKKTGQIVDVYWSDRYLFLVDGFFSPDSKIAFLGYDSPSDRTHLYPWKGFRQRDP